MPFKSEKQRKYLWANEPEIARDWTDTYGSRIHKLHGGITHADGRRGFFKGAEADARAGRASMSPGTHHGGGGRGGRNGSPTGDGKVAGNIFEPKVLQPGLDKSKAKMDRKKAILSGAIEDPEDSSTWNFADGGRIGFFEAGLAAGDEISPGTSSSGGGRGGPPGRSTVARPKITQPKKTIKQHIGEGIQKYRKKGIENYLDRNQFRQMQNLGLINNPSRWSIINNLVSGATGKVPEWAKDWSADELIALTGTGPYAGATNAPTGKQLEKAADRLRVTEDFRGTLDEPNLQTRFNEQFSGPKVDTGGGGEGLPYIYPTTGVASAAESSGQSDFDKYLAGLGGDYLVPIEYVQNQTRSADGGRVPAAYGGIMDSYTGRRAYGLGSSIKKAFKKATKAVKKLVSSDIGKLAMLYGAGTYLGGTQAFGGTGWGSGAGATPWKKFGAKLLDPTGSQGIGNVFRPSGWSMFQKAAPVSGAGIGGEKEMLAELVAETGPLTKGEELRRAINLSKTKALPNVAKSDWSKYILPASIGAGLYTAAAPIEGLDDTQGEWDEDKEAFDRYLASLNTGDSYRVPEEYRKAQGGRIGRQEGGLMDLGGMEKDYRNDGGFVPLGGEEKADDVPARLSRNEFVFTADAVRNAGGGDIDKGAEVMENVMKNLEAGGKVSEESQGQGAQEMFEVSERLSEVV
jgi:hypothetical protein